ncbi:membrane-bound lytic murein transglycosylase MltF [Utexia brackfieldae]|uniref:membrane-bound lytic murein transglycosylase MltF n=1 Tax=Utexia brackfieldae TaxID=3074108 RepID=UPI00370D6EE1
MLFKRAIVCGGIIIICLIGYLGYIAIKYYQQQIEYQALQQAVLIQKQALKTLIDSKPKLEQVHFRRELRIGMLRSLTPFYINSRAPNKLSGFEYSLLSRYARLEEVDLKVVFADTLTELLTQLEENNIDLIAEELQGHTNYKEKVIASMPYYSAVQQLVYLKEQIKPYSFNDINGKLLVAVNSPQSHMLSKLSNEYTHLKWEQSAVFNQEELLKLVATKEIDYTIADALTISVMRRIYPALTVAFSTDEAQPLHFYFTKSSDRSLLSSINQFIKQSQQNGTIERLENRYFSYIDDFDYVDTRQFLRAIENTLPQFEAYFKEYAQQYHFDWRLIAAMSYQESHWNPHATSSTGVRGIMMLTQNTADDLGVSDRLNAQQSIRGGTQYLGNLVKRISTNVPEEERVWHALVAYNMGYGHLLDVRRLARHLGKNPDNWTDLKQVLPLVSLDKYQPYLKYGRAKGYQALHFVNSIQQYYVSLVGYQLEKAYRQKQIDDKLKNIRSGKNINRRAVRN